MDFGYLLQILARRKWLIFSAMLLSGIVVFYLIGRKPEQYKATVLMATGIVTYKSFNSDGDDAFVQQFQIENAFSNLIDFAQSRSSFKILTLHLLQHDLNPSTPTPFRQPNLNLYGPGIQDEARRLFDQIDSLHLDSISDPSFSQQTDYLLDRVSRAYGYDHDAIGRMLKVKRKGTTDYLTVEAVTERPELSQYLANSYVQLFMGYYHNLAVREKRKNVQFYKNLSFEKKAVVDTLKQRKYAYLFRKGLPALGRQSEELVTQLTDLELQKQKAAAKRLASAEAMNQIQQYIDNRNSLEAQQTRSRVVDKYSVADLSAKVRDLTEKSVAEGGKNTATETELSGARHALDMALKSNSGSLARSSVQENARRTKEELFKDKIQADVDRIEAEKSIAVLDAEIGRQNARLSTFVANDEVASGLAADQLNAEEEYKKITDELIKANLSLANAENPMHVIENAQLPEWPEPNRQVLISLFSAIVVGTMIVIALFLMAYMDRSIQSPDVFARYTDHLGVLGYTPFIPTKKLVFDQIFGLKAADAAWLPFRESLRKIRNAIQRDGSKTWLFTSTQPAQGKTLTAYSLAHALAANHKKIVVLDTNFKTPLPVEFPDQAGETSSALTDIMERYQLNEIFDAGKVYRYGQGAVAVVRHHGAHLSPSELLPETAFRQLIADLSVEFDYVFMEAAALNDFSDAQELLPFTDKVVAVFHARTVLGVKDHASIRLLKSMKEKFAGAVLTGVEEKNMI